jgi:hypothetical protein
MTGGGMDGLAESEEFGKEAEDDKICSSRAQILFQFI